jgi:hypothetical protein
VAEEVDIDDDEAQNPSSSAARNQDPSVSAARNQDPSVTQRQQDEAEIVNPLAAPPRQEQAVRRKLSSKWYAKPTKKKTKASLKYQVDHLAESTGKGVTVHVLLAYFKNNGTLGTSKKRLLRELLCPNQQAEPQKFRAAMELVETVITDDQWLVLRTNELESVEFNDVCRKVQNECLSKLRNMEEAAGLRKPVADKKMTRAQPTYVGLGSRVISYKKELNISSLTAEEQPKNTLTRFAQKVVRSSPVRIFRNPYKK